MSAPQQQPPAYVAPQHQAPSPPQRHASNGALTFHTQHHGHAAYAHQPQPTAAAFLGEHAQHPPHHLQQHHVMPGTAPPTFQSFGQPFGGQQRPCQQQPPCHNLVFVTLSDVAAVQPHAGHFAAWPAGPPAATAPAFHENQLYRQTCPPVAVAPGGPEGPTQWQLEPLPVVPESMPFVQQHSQPPPTYHHHQHHHHEANSHPQPLAITPSHPARIPAAAALMHPAPPAGRPLVPAKTHPDSPTGDRPTGDPSTCASQSGATDDPHGPRQVIVNGIATATTADDVRDVFERWAPGCVERVNLPLRRSGHHRGYAFVYLTDSAVAARAIVELTGHARLSSEIRGSGINVQWANQRAAAPPAAPPHSPVVGSDTAAPAQHHPPLASVTASSSASSVMSACGKALVPLPIGTVFVP